MIPDFREFQGKTFVSNDEIYHHGVLGMHWGIRRYQPYPKGYSGSGKEVGEAKRTHHLKYTSPMKKETANYLKYAGNYLLSALIPGYGLLYNAIAVAKLTKNTRNDLDGTDYTKKEGAIEKLKDVPKKKIETTVVQDCRIVNKRIGQQKGKVKNCAYCSMAMEMRSRGYDVIARSKASGMSTSDVGKWFKDINYEFPKIEREANESRKQYVARAYDEVCNKMESYGNGARGCFSFNYEKMNSGHMIFWEVQNGNVIFYDGQSGEVGKQTDKTISMADPVTFSFARLDNLKTKDNIMETCRTNPKIKEGK